MADKFNKGVPGVPLAALNAIQDPNTRDVLTAIVDGWNVRNGDAGQGDSRFITKGEIGDLVVTTIGNNFGYGLGGARRPTNMDWIQQLLRDLQAEIMNSRLWTELGERIQGVNTDLVREQQERVAAVQQVANDLAAEAATRLGFDQVHGSAINALTTTTETQATQISGLTTRIGGAENTIINLQQTTQAQATALTQLTSRMNGAESSITSLQTTTANQAQSLNSLITRMGGAESNISTLNTTTANQANSIDILFTRLYGAEAAISLEQTTRANSDNAITNSVATQFSQVNGNLAALQSQQNTTANNVAALSSSVTTLQATTGENRALIQQEAIARTNADNDIYGKYSVKIDVNGYVAGFGLIAEGNNAVRSSFIVRADSFAIGSPSGPGIPARVPFIVRTTHTTLPNGRVVPPGVYMDYAAVDQLDGVYIRAGLFEAGQIYSGSEWIDRQSGQRILTTAISTWNASFNGSAVANTDSRMRFYGPGHHHYVPVNQRARGGAYGGNVDFTVVATCMANHWITIWFRVNNGGWSPIMMATEPQSSYGAVSVIGTVSLWMGWGDFVDFGISSTANNGDPYNTSKPDIRDLSMYVSLCNI